MIYSGFITCCLSTCRFHLPHIYTMPSQEKAKQTHTKSLYPSLPVSVFNNTHMHMHPHTHRHIQLPNLISPRPHTYIQGTGCGMPWCLLQYKGRRGQRRTVPEL